MAITVSDAADLVTAQLHIQSGAETPPTSAMIQNFVRRGARRIIASLQPVFLTNATLSSALAGTVSGKAQIIHVEVNTNALALSEWRETTTGITIPDYQLASSGDTAYIWYTKQLTVASGATTVDLDCIHGGDWGFEAIVTYAEMLAEERLSATDASNAVIHLQRYRTLERRYEMMLAEMRQRRESDLAVLGARVQHRLQFGRGTWRESGVSGFRNESDIIDRTAGEN